MNGCCAPLLPFSLCASESSNCSICAVYGTAAAASSQPPLETDPSLLVCRLVLPALSFEGYDGGDCCRCTCVPPVTSSDDYACTDDINFFACVDPDADCVDDDDITVGIIDNCGRPGTIGDGFCDQSNNKAECSECAFPGSVACRRCSVRSERARAMYRSVHAFMFHSFLPLLLMLSAPLAPHPPLRLARRYDRGHEGGGGWGLDPLLRLVLPLVRTTSNRQSTRAPTRRAELKSCLPGTNKLSVPSSFARRNAPPFSGYDGGDCCSCTCVPPETSSDDRACTNDVGFACIDPDAPCSEDDDITPDMVENCDDVSPVCLSVQGRSCTCVCQGKTHLYDERGA